MKPIESIIAAYLADYAALKAVHGGHCQQGLANQKWIAPYQSVFLISDPPDMKRIGHPRPRLQIDSFSLKLIPLKTDSAFGSGWVFRGFGWRDN